MISRLKENIKLNKLSNIQAFNYGVGEKNSKDYFNDNDNEFMNLGSYRFEKKKNSRLLKVIALDSFLKKFQLFKYNKIVIKLDIEGYEFEALRGLEKIIKSFKPIFFIEISKMLLEHPNFSINKFNHFLIKNNLIFVDLLGKKIKFSRLIKKLKNVKKNHQTIGDYFLINKNCKLFIRS